jgi:hypothetical protein
VTQAGITFTLAAGYSISQFWNLQQSGDSTNTFVIPTPWGPIQVGASQGAGYVVRSPTSSGSQTAPTFTLAATTCSGVSASPSASPSAAPASPSPSTIVSTPQPSPVSGCAAVTSLVARSAAQGGQWNETGYTFQIYDITTTNTGSKPVTGAQLTFNLASGVTITQWWELNQLSASVFNIAFNYGPLQVGASQGAGVVERYAQGSSPSASVAIGSVSCP